MALQIGLNSYVSAGYTNPIIWRLRETGTGVLVDEHQEVGPHGVVYSFAFTNNIRDLIYTIAMYDQPGGVGTGTLIKSWDVSVTTSTVLFDADIETIVGGGQPEDPTIGATTSPIIAELVGREYSVLQRGIGQMYTVRDPDIEINPDGSYSWLNGNTFNEFDRLIIQIKPQYVINPAGSSQGSSIYKAIEVKTIDYTVTSLDFGKLLILDGIASVITLQFPAIADIPENVTLYIQSIGTTHINAVLKAAFGEFIGVANSYVLSKQNSAQVLRVGSVLYCFCDDEEPKKRGQIEWGYYASVNRVKAYGTEYLSADYPGLFAAINAMSTTVTYAQWSSVVDGKQPYKGFYAISPDTLNFKVPDLKNKSIRFINGDSTDTERVTQGAGGFQLEMVGDHSHRVGTEPSTDSEFHQGALHNVRNWDTTNSNGSQTASTASLGALENRPENIGLIPLIIV